MNDRHGQPGKGLWAFSLVTLAFLFVAFSLPLLGEEVVNSRESRSRPPT